MYVTVAAEAISKCGGRGGQAEADSRGGVLDFLGPHQLGGLGERCKLPQRGSGRSPDRKRILGAYRLARKRGWWLQISFSFC